MELQGKGAIVTGGTGALGAAVVAELLAAGTYVYIPYRKEAEFQALLDSLDADLREHAIGAPLDLTDEAQVKSVYAAFAATHSGIDFLVNAAGGFGGGKPVHQSSWELWQQQLDINLKTTVLSCQAAIPWMIERGGGAIVNVSSRTAVQSGSKLAAYAAAKRAILQLTETLAAELLTQHIRANVILPSVIDTPANRKGMPNAAHDSWVKPAEIAAVIRFLLGPNAQIISGASIPVYGEA